MPARGWEQRGVHQRQAGQDEDEDERRPGFAGAYSFVLGEWPGSRSSLGPQVTVRCGAMVFVLLEWVRLCMASA